MAGFAGFAGFAGLGGRAGTAWRTDRFPGGGPGGSGGGATGGWGGGAAVPLGGTGRPYTIDNNSIAAKHIIIVLFILTDFIFQPVRTLCLIDGQSITYNLSSPSPPFYTKKILIRILKHVLSFSIIFTFFHFNLSKHSLILIVYELKTYWRYNLIVNRHNNDESLRSQSRFVSY